MVNIRILKSTTSIRHLSGKDNDICFFSPCPSWFEKKKDILWFESSTARIYVRYDHDTCCMILESWGSSWRLHCAKRACFFLFFQIFHVLYFGNPSYHPSFILFFYFSCHFLDPWVKVTTCILSDPFGLFHVCYSVLRFVSSPLSVFFIHFLFFSPFPNILVHVYLAYGKFWAENVLLPWACNTPASHLFCLPFFCPLDVFSMAGFLYFFIYFTGGFVYTQQRSAGRVSYNK